jgi:hypothetical protein
MVQSSTAKFMTCAHLECQTWGANHDLQIKVFTRLMNALCCGQTLPLPKVLTNYLDGLGLGLRA